MSRRCDRCNGRGQIRAPGGPSGYLAIFQNFKPCPACKGHGKVFHGGNRFSGKRK